MRARLRGQDGNISVKLQAIVIIGVVALLGLVVVPVWVSRAASPHEASLAMNVETVTQVYAMAAANGMQASPLRQAGSEAAAALRGSLLRPVANQRSHSVAVQAGDEWRTKAGTAPGVWITSSPDASPATFAADPGLRLKLSGAVIVYLSPDGSVDVYGVAYDGSQLDSLKHLAI